MEPVTKTDKDYNGRVQLSPAIVEALRDGKQWQLLQKSGGGGRIRQEVDFAHELVREAFLTCPYEFLWRTDIPSHANQVVCLFPNHESRTDERAQILWASQYWFLSSFNKEINKRFKASLDYTEQGGTVKFALAYGAHVYVCNGIAGHIYVLWASHINRTNHGNVPNTLYQDVPVIINTNGRKSVIGIYILKPQVREEWDLLRIPITKESPTFMNCDDADFFVCDVRDINPAPPISSSAVVDPIQLAANGYCLATRKEALARILARTPNLQRQAQHQHGAMDETSVDWEHAGAVDVEIIRENNNSK